MNFKRKREMRIAYLVPALNNQAPIVIATTLAKIMVSQGHNISIYYFDSGPIRYIDENIHVERIDFFQNIPWENFDIVHSHTLRTDAYVFIHKPYFSKVKTVTTAHNYIYPELRNYYNAITSIVFGTLWLILWLRMDRICVLTKHALSYYKRISPNKNISICPNGRVLDDYQEEIPAEIRQLCLSFAKNYKYTIGAYCNLIKRKRIDRLIDLLDVLDDIGLIVIGDGPEREDLLKQASCLGVKNRVLFLGYQTMAHRFNEFFDVFAMPSEDEGFGISLIEAALHAKNIICSDIPVFREIFDDNSVTFFGADKNSLKKAFEVAISTQAKSLNAKYIAGSKFSDIAMASHYNSVYARVLGIFDLENS